MTPYLAPSEQAALAALRPDTAAEVSNAHWSMRDTVQRACDIRNDLIDLMTGTGRFDGIWQQIATLPDGSQAPFDPGAFAPLVDGLSAEVRSRQSPHTSLDHGFVRSAVVRIATLDAGHPLAKHWRVLNRACAPYGRCEDWPEIEAIIQAVKDAEVEAARQAQAAIEHDAQAAAIAAAEAKAKHDAEFAAASLQNVPSGYTVDHSAEIVTKSED